MPGIENLNLQSINPYNSITSRFSQSFQQFVKEIADAKSKGEEDRIITKEIAKLKIALLKPDAGPKQKKEQLVKLIYCEMLGHEVSFAYMEAVKFAQQQDLMHKRVAYIALGIFLDERNETECMMNIGSIQRDLKSSNVINICFGLIAASKLVYKDMMQAVLPSVVSLLKDNREIIRKKAIMAMFHFWKINATACDYLKYFHEALFDKDPAVMGASLIVYSHLVQQEPLLYKNLTSSFVSILKQILDKRLPEEYSYKNIPSPWMQIQLLKILANLGSDDASQSKLMYEVLRQCLECTTTDQSIGFSVLYECMKTIATIYLNRGLMESSAMRASMFLMSDDYNLKYLGIKTLTDFVGINVSYASRHQQVIIDCLNDQDDTLKRKTLDLLYRMTNVSNVKVICEKMIHYLRSTIDDYVRGDLVTRITTLAEKYAPDNEWYIETMNEVFELGGNLVSDDIAHNVMRIIGEGVDDDGDNKDEEENSATLELRRNAVFAYVNLMEKPMLPDILVKLICWVVGEYIGSDDGYDIGEIIDRFYGMLYRRFNDKYTQSWIMTAITKILARCSNPQQFFRQINPICLLQPDAKQRYIELKTIIDLCVDVEDVLPFDASCEDLDVDEELSFLDGFVQQALNNGARTYAPHKMNENDVSSKQEDGNNLKFIYPEPSKHQPSHPSRPNNSETEDAETHHTERGQSPQSDLPKDTSRLTKKTTWTKEGRLRQSSECEMATPSPPPSSSAHGHSDDSQTEKADEDSNSSSRSSKLPENTFMSTETTVKSKKDEKLMNALFGEGGGNTSPSGIGGSVNNSHGAQGKNRRQYVKQPKPRNPTQHTSPLPQQPQLLQHDLLGGLTEIEVSSSLSPLVTMETVLSDESQTSNLLSLQDPTTQMGLSPTLKATVNEEPQATSGDLLDGMQLQETLHKVDDHQLESMSTHQQPIHQQPTLDAVLPTSPNDILLKQQSENPLDASLPAESDAMAATETIATTPESSHLPMELTGFNCSALCEITSDICVRVTSQNVYKPHELATVLFILNKTSNPLKNITFNIQPSSSLRGHTDELNYQSDTELAGTNSFCHVIHLSYHSPSPRMVANGHISYRDYTNTEKKLFLNITHRWNDLLRPLTINTEIFAEKWLNRGLHERKKTVQNSVKPTVLSTTLQSLNLEVIQQIGVELIAACTVLGKEEMLIHFNTMKTTVEVNVKSTSERLNEYVLEMLCSAL